MENSEKRLIIRNIILAAVMAAAIVLLCLRYGSAMLSLLRDLESFRAYVLSFGRAGVLVFMLFQMAHILIPFLPGELVQIGGGFLFGTFLGTIFMLIATTAGTILTFFIARFIGYPIVNIFVSREQMKKFAFLIKSPKVEVSLLLLFLLPGIPKDTLIYIVGLTPIKPVRFFCISILARTPGMIGCAYMGSHIMQRDYQSALIVAAISLLLLVLGLCFRRTVMKIAGSLKGIGG